ncbi:MAG: hypothetical protein ACJASO_003095, partial [Cyclobacteriaceae bacterium]
SSVRFNTGCCLKDKVIFQLHEAKIIGRLSDSDQLNYLFLIFVSVRVVVRTTSSFCCFDDATVSSFIPLNNIPHPL